MPHVVRREVQEAAVQGQNLASSHPQQKRKQLLVCGKAFPLQDRGEERFPHLLHDVPGVKLALEGWMQEPRRPRGWVHRGRPAERRGAYLRF